MTFALREALCGLDLVASELDPLYGDRPLARRMEELMCAEPRHWAHHYRGSAEERRILRHYSYSDRIRYYWPHPSAEAAVDRLFTTLSGRSVPRTLLSQFLPLAAQSIGEGRCEPEPTAIASLYIEQVLETYAAARRPGPARS